MSTWKGLYTRKQLTQLFSTWGVSAEVPTPARHTLIAFPPGAQFVLARIEPAAAKSDQGKRLFLVELSNPPPVGHRRIANEKIYRSRNFFLAP